MQPIHLFHVDAFTDKVFHGNPAAVCFLSEWFNDELLQAIATENNLSETAFLIEDENGYNIRWFTPLGEIDLCGHATLAAGFVLFEMGRVTGDEITFSSLSGALSVQRDGESYTLSLPAFSCERINEPSLLERLLDKPILEAYESELDYLVLLEHEQAVASVKVDLPALAKLPKRGLIMTAPGSDVDFYSRCFYPRYNLQEDPVTGSAHCALTPFWMKRLAKTKLRARQGLARQGSLVCTQDEGRVHLSGQCRWFLKGHIHL